MKKRLSIDVSNFSLKSIDDAIISNSTKKIIDNVETDTQFIENMFAVAEHVTTVKKQVFAKRADLTEEQYNLIEDIGDIHYKCNIFNQTSSQDVTKIQEQYRCPCGCKRAFGQSLPFCINEEEQTFFGPGIILFFYYTKRIFLLLFSVVLIYAVFAIVSNMLSKKQKSDCSNPGALAFLCEFKIQSSVEGKQGEETLMLIQLILGLVVCLIWPISIRMIRAIGRKKEKVIDEFLDSSSDYCLFLQNLPAGGYSEIDVLRYLKSQWRKLDDSEEHPLKIKAIQIIYKMDQVREKILTIQNLAQEMVKYVKRQKQKMPSRRSYIIKDKYLEKYESKKQKILKTYTELKQFRQKFVTDSEFRSKLSSQCAVVEFATSQQQSKFIDEFGTFRRTFVKDIMKKLKQKCASQDSELAGRSIKAFRSPQPSDIFWKHCENPVSKLKIFIVWMINLALIGLSLGALILVSFIKAENPSLTWFSIVGIITLNLFNRLIWNVLLNIVFIEQNYTKTDNIISVMNKSFVTQAINLIIVPMVVSIGINGKIDGVDGLMGTIHDFQLTACIFMALFNLVNVPHRITMLIQHIKCFRRMAIRYFCRVTGELDTIDQMRDALTFLYDPPAVPVAGLYVYITTVMSQAAFFCHLSPIILVYLTGSIIFFHLINRYLILRMSKITDMIDFLVFETCIGYALNFPLLYGIGSIVFLNLRGDAPNFGYYVPSMLCIVVWFFSVQSPFGLYRRIVDCLMNCFYDEQKKQSDSQSAKDKTYLRFIVDALDDAKKKKESEEKEISKRKQNYYGANGTVEMFNFESKLQEAQGPYHNKNKQYCERFNLLSKHNTYEVLDGINMISIG